MFAVAENSTRRTVPSPWTTSTSPRARPSSSWWRRARPSSSRASGGWKSRKVRPTMLLAGEPDQRAGRRVGVGEDGALADEDGVERVVERRLELRQGRRWGHLGCGHPRRPASWGRMLRALQEIVRDHVPLDLVDRLGERAELLRQRGPERAELRRQLGALGLVEPAPACRPAAPGTRGGGPGRGACRRGRRSSRPRGGRRSAGGALRARARRSSTRARGRASWPRGGARRRGAPRRRRPRGGGTSRPRAGPRPRGPRGPRRGRGARRGPRDCPRGAAP